MLLAQEAYEAYANHAGGPLPQWEHLSPEIQKGWDASAAWVAGKVSGGHDWLIPVKDTVFANKIKEETADQGSEDGHQIADELLCELLLALGCNQTVEAWKAVKKWYA